MRKTLLMLLVISGVAEANAAFAQTQSVANPAPTATYAARNNISSATTVEAVPTADPIAAAPATAEKKTAEQANDEKKADTTKMQPDDSRKSPYWEPKDWTYIYNQGP